MQGVWTKKSRRETGNFCYERIQWSDEKEHGLIPTDFELAVPKIFRADQIALQDIREYGKDRRTHTPPVRSLATAFLSILSFPTPPSPPVSPRQTRYGRSHPTSPSLSGIWQVTAPAVRSYAQHPPNQFQSPTHAPTHPPTGPDISFQCFWGKWAALAKMFQTRETRLKREACW